jgi:hypothetical protein
MQAEKDIVRFLIAALVVAAVYDLFVLGKGTGVVNLTSTSFKGLGGIFARLTGGTPPAGY